MGRKPQLLLAVVDMTLGSADEPVPAEQRDYVVAVRAAATAGAKIDVYAAALGRLMPTVVPLLEALAQAAVADPECARVRDAIAERRADNMLLFAADLRATGSCAPTSTTAPWPTSCGPPTPAVLRAAAGAGLVAGGVRRAPRGPVAPTPAGLRAGSGLRGSRRIVGRPRITGMTEDTGSRETETARARWQARYDAVAGPRRPTSRR